MKFLFDYWSGSAGCVLSDIVLYITHGSSCHRLKTADGMVLLVLRRLWIPVGS